MCVLDIDLLELAITTWKGNNTGKLVCLINADFILFFPPLHFVLLLYYIVMFFHVQTQPLFELRCSNNVVHVHTCADSCAALVNMLQYLVSQGDLHPPPRHTSPTEIAGQKLPVRISVNVFSVHVIL